MPTITQIRTAMVSTITTALPALNGYRNVTDVVQVPAVVARPEKCNYIVAGGQCSEWVFALYVLVARTDATTNQDELDGYITPTGANSVPAILFANPTLGLTGIDCVLESMTGYGGKWESASVPHIGAQLNVRVLITE